MKTIEVVAAMIQVEDMILVVQRKEDEKAYKSLKWEFPGGKVEEGERPEDAVVREVKEELQLDIEPVEALGRVVYEYPDVKVDLTLFHCALRAGFPLSANTMTFVGLTNPYCTLLTGLLLIVRFCNWPGGWIN